MKRYDILPKPVRACRDSICLGSGLEGVNLSRVQPRQWKPCGAEEGNVGEQAEGSTLCWVGVGRVDRLWDQTCHDDHHREALSDGSSKEQLAATDILDKPP